MEYPDVLVSMHETGASSLAAEHTEASPAVQWSPPRFSLLHRTWARKADQKPHVHIQWKGDMRRTIGSPWGSLAAVSTPNRHTNGSFRAVVRPLACIRRRPEQPKPRPFNDLRCRTRPADHVRTAPRSCFLGANTSPECR